jgi:cell division septation protein DedD
MASSPLPTTPLPVVSAATSVGLFYVNVGLFADASNAQRAHHKLKGAGLPVLSQRVVSPKGELTRVRVGPFANRGKADQAAKKIKAMALDAVVVQP